MCLCSAVYGHLEMDLSPFFPWNPLESTESINFRIYYYLFFQTRIFKADDSYVHISSNDVYLLSLMRLILFYFSFCAETYVLPLFRANTKYFT